ncbi:MAG TPA: sialidase family protein [Rhodothermales bacterium]|nr:sialidase family protein [Rhodothermales bacterium]
MSGSVMQSTAAAVLVAAVLASGCGEASTVGEQPLRLGTEMSAVSTTAVGLDGTVYWAWFDRDADATNVYFSRLGPGEDGPSTPIRVNRVDGEANMHGQAPAQLAVGSNGDIYVVWTSRIEVEGRRFPASDVLFARSADRGLTFSEARIVNDDAGGPPTGHTFHDVAVSPDGTIYVSWIDTRALDAARNGSSDAMHHVDGEVGHMHGHHESMMADMPGPEIRVAKSTDGGRSFGTSAVVDASSCPCCRTSLAVGADGAVYVAWRKVYEGDIRDVALSRSVDGGATFSDARRVHVDGWNFTGCPHTGPDIVVDAGGGVHVAWYTGAAGGSGLFYAVSDGDRFTEPVTLLSDAPVSQVRMAQDGERGVWLAWENSRDGAINLAHAQAGIVEPVIRAFSGDQPSMAVGNGVISISWTTPHGVAAEVIRQ